MQLDRLIKGLPDFITGNWSVMSKLHFLYSSTMTAELRIPHSEDSWRIGYLEFGGMTTIKAISQAYLTVEEREMLLEDFVENILEPFCYDNSDIKYLMLNAN